MSEFRSFQALASQVDRSLSPPNDEQQRRHHLQAFQAELQLQAQQRNQPASTARRRRFAWAAAAAVAAMLAVVTVGAIQWAGSESRVAIFRWRPFEVIAGHTRQPGQPGHHLHAAAGQPVQARFAGGSQIRLEAGAQVRVARSLQSQVWCVILRGTLLASVTRAPGTSWILSAGPYQVQVVGTQFQVSWAPQTGSLRVRVSKGQVRVVGPDLGPDGISVSGGQELRVGRSKAVLIGFRASSRAGHPPHDQALLATAEPLQTMASLRRPATTRRVRSASSRSTSRRLGRQWRTLLNQGHYERIVREAVSHKLGRLPAEALWSLAHAYRYTRRVARAIAVLKVYRRRFSRSGNSRRAAYLLGRLHLEGLGQPVAARRWFERYLKESPKGPLARAAKALLQRATTQARQR